MQIVLLIIGFFFSPQPNVSSSITDLECEMTYDKLTIQVRPSRDYSDTYYLNNQLYTGCAKADHPENEQYFIYQIKNGKCMHKIGYYYNGQLGQEFFFDETGMAHGKHVMYYPDGSPYIEENYLHGQNHGTLKRWHNNGQLARDAYYNYGMKITEKFFNEEGKEVKGEC